MQRLFSTFPDGWPGAGLLLLRLALSAALVHELMSPLAAARLDGPAALHWAAAAAALLLLGGLWTPVAGVLMAIIQLWAAVAQPGDAWTAMLIGALALGLAMLGPGAWSIDAHLCGRKRIEIRPR